MAGPITVELNAESDSTQPGDKWHFDSWVGKVEGLPSASGGVLAKVRQIHTISRHRLLFLLQGVLSDATGTTTTSIETIGAYSGGELLYPYYSDGGTAKCEKDIFKLDGEPSGFTREDQTWRIEEAPTAPSTLEYDDPYESVGGIIVKTSGWIFAGWEPSIKYTRNKVTKKTDQDRTMYAFKRYRFLQVTSGSLENQILQQGDPEEITACAGHYDGTKTVRPPETTNGATVAMRCLADSFKQEVLGANIIREDQTWSGWTANG
jgi:hypothetical protein